MQKNNVKEYMGFIKKIIYSLLLFILISCSNSNFFYLFHIAPKYDIKKIDKLINEGDYYSSIGRYDIAMIYYQSVIDLDTDNSEARVKHTEAYLKNNSLQYFDFVDIFKDFDISNTTNLDKISSQVLYDINLLSRVIITDLSCIARKNSDNIELYDDIFINGYLTIAYGFSSIYTIIDSSGNGITFEQGSNGDIVTVQEGDIRLNNDKFSIQSFENEFRALSTCFSNIVDTRLGLMITNISDLLNGTTNMRLELDSIALPSKLVISNLNSALYSEYLLKNSLYSATNTMIFLSELMGGTNDPTYAVNTIQSNIVPIEEKISSIISLLSDYIDILYSSITGMETSLNEMLNTLNAIDHSLWNNNFSSITDISPTEMSNQVNSLLANIMLEEMGMTNVGISNIWTLSNGAEPFFSSFENSIITNITGL